jgi:general secretion pathway protein D
MFRDRAKKIIYLLSSCLCALCLFTKDLYADEEKNNFQDPMRYATQLHSNVAGLIHQYVPLAPEKPPYALPTLTKPNNPPPPEKVQTVTMEPKKEPIKRLWNLRDADINSVVQEVSRETGKNFIIDPHIQGKVSIISSSPITSDEAYKVFLSVLQVYGYAAMPEGNVIKIVQDTAVKELAMPVFDHRAPLEGDTVIARVMPVKNILADQLVPILRPLMPPSGNISAYGPGNVVILVGRAANVERIAAIIQRIDTENTDNIDAIPLQNSQASDLVQTIHNLQTGDNKELAPHVAIAADDISNTILISGHKASRLKMKILISELDTPNASAPGGNTQIISLHYLRAQDLVPILVGIAKSNFHGNVDSVIGTITTQKDYSAQETGEGNVMLPASPPVQPTTTVTATTTSPANNKPQVGIIAEPNTNSIILNGPPNLLLVLRKVIAKLDVRPPQILVEALLAEVDERTTCQLGIRWGTVTEVGFLGSVNPGIPLGKDGKFIQGLGIMSRHGYFRNIAAIVQALQNNRNADILSTPSVVVLDNHEAKILVGQKISIQQSSYPNNAGATTTASPYTTFSRENVALHLFVTPQINQGKSIQLSIDAGDDTLANPETPSTTPIVNTSAIKTSVLVNNGDILVLGGLIQNHLSKSQDTVPFLGKIPVIKYLVGVDAKSTVKKNLLIFLRPIIILDPSCSNAITEAKYNFMREQELAWERSEPHCDNCPPRAVLPPPDSQVNLPTPF